MLTRVLAPLAARGLIVRRPRVTAWLEHRDADRRAVELLRGLRRRHGPGPLRLRIPGRSIVVLLDRNDVRRVLHATPEPFSPATREKRGALAHFQPYGVLISRGPARAERRRLVEQALDTDVPIHRHGSAVTAKAREEADRLADTVLRTGTLTWGEFGPAWWRLVRRVVLGDQASEDHEISDLLTTLRARANWSYLSPRQPRARRRFARLLSEYVGRAEPGSLAAAVANTPSSPDAMPISQIPQWLFAFEPAGLVTLRALALLASHPRHAERARAEAEAVVDDTPRELPYLRACLLESVRLWPTTPALLRETTEETDLLGVALPRRTTVLIVTPLFHRDPETLPGADRFDPAVWLEGRADDQWSLLPFSGGPGRCPGRDLVLLTASTALAVLLNRTRPRLLSTPSLDPRRPLPGTVDPYSVRLAITPR
ncbi:Epi-isozizaene 5-monooxygenase/(E)-beta-farnesene synthase [Actinoalloteichus hoggarensis]|uniref:Epi-isozizaene 5-monooxygenase/(E)-beta-farnesene synthase n=1 Tax=Actinoalloteichus hoggarensis TaxID=1470176 RepID=A0A221W7F1_9PSEU|nr:Epi-isozizaene 5-monooxygenase/(E)-beta-farnesene synthase [Actinoalloteichus hoggarensis]